MADQISTIFAPTSKKYYSSGQTSSSKSKSKNIIAFIVTALGVVLTSYFGYMLVSRSGGSKPYLFADVYYNKAQVFVDGNNIGETPVEEYVMKKGTHKVRLESGDSSYETSLQFVSGTSTLIKRDLGVDQVFSSGLDMWYEKTDSANTLSVISEPSEAMVFIDGTEAGKTPFSTDKLAEGGYDIRLEKSGYESQSARLMIVGGQKASASFKLFPMPASASVALMEGSANIYDVLSGNTFVTSGPQNWAKALIYWNRTRGINIMGYGINRELVFSYILDVNGVFYNTEGSIVESEKVLLGDGKIAYLRPEMEGAGVSVAAKDSLAKIGTGVVGGSTAKVISTPTGWLRVRDSASLNGTEIGKINVDDVVSVLEEQVGWLKIKTIGGLEGWASSDYLQIL